MASQVNMHALKAGIWAVNQWCTYVETDKAKQDLVGELSKAGVLSTIGELVVFLELMWPKDKEPEKRADVMRELKHALLWPRAVIWYRPRKPRAKRATEPRKRVA